LLCGPSELATPRDSKKAFAGEIMSTAVEVSATALEKPLGMRKNGMSMRRIKSKSLSLFCSDVGIPQGKQWHAPRGAFRPGSGLTSYDQRSKQRALQQQVKAKEKELKDEKEAERQVR
jgi:hypothetical protein